MIETPTRPAIFVFGSNRAGRHGRGAALAAAQSHGAVHGVGEGLTGYAYALPTKDHRIQTLPLDEVRVHVERFLDCAHQFCKRRFNITEVGCGLAGYQRRDILPLFERGHRWPNLYWPETWARSLGTTRVSFDSDGRPVCDGRTLVRR